MSSPGKKTPSETERWLGFESKWKNATGRPKRSPTPCQKNFEDEDDDEYEYETIPRFPAMTAIPALLTEQFGNEFIKGRAPNLHGMDLIRVLLEGIRNLQLIQALDEFLGTRARYQVLAAGRNI
jgi:hypothetical protein